jgi:hypothetical protein
MIRSQLLVVAVASTCLLACGAASDGGGGGPGPGTTVDVHGRVVGPTGVALSGLSVGIGGKTAVTDVEGRFSIGGIVPPYDVDVTLDGTTPSVVRYEGLTRPDPTLSFLLLFGNGQPNTATVAGTISGGEPIGSEGLFTTAFFSTPDARFDFTAIGVTSRNNPFTLPVSWFGPQAISGTVHVLQFASPGPGEPPTAYTGYGTHPALAVARDGEVTGADVALTAPANATIDGTIVPPDGFRVLEKTLGLEIAGLTAVPIAHVDTGDEAFTFVVPDEIPATAAVTVNAQSDEGGSTSRRLAGIAPGSTGITLALPVPARLVSPEDGATVGAGTDLTWAPLEHAVHLISMSAGPGEPFVYVFTARATTRVPRLPGGATYQWFVAALGPYDGIDAFAGGGAALFPALGESFQAISATRSFVVR